MGKGGLTHCVGFSCQSIKNLRLCNNSPKECFLTKESASLIIYFCVLNCER